MNTIPILFSFDENLAFPAAVCICSLASSADIDTFYEINIFYSGKEPTIFNQEQILNTYSNIHLSYIDVGDAFQGAHEERGITHATYFRLLAAELLPQFNKIIYSDVDIIFRMDLWQLFNIELGGNYVGAVLATGIYKNEKDEKRMNNIGIGSELYFCAGFLVMDLKKFRDAKLTQKFIAHSNNNYKYQDQDILNIVCAGHILQLPRSASMSVNDFYLLELDYSSSPMYANTTDENARFHSNIHYNGQKPWKGLCPNFDIWWEYYRKSPIFDPTYYFKFFYNQLEPLEHLGLMQRVKTLVRYFVYGKKKDI